VIEVETQPLALSLVDVDVIAQHPEKGLCLLDHTGQLV